MSISLIGKRVFYNWKKLIFNLKMNMFSLIGKGLLYTWKRPNCSIPGKGLTFTWKIITILKKSVRVFFCNFILETIPK